MEIFRIFLKKYTKSYTKLLIKYFTLEGSVLQDRLRSKVCVYGNIDDMQVLANENKRDVKLRTFKAIRDAAEGGGYILGGTESSIYNIETAKSFILMSKISSIYGNYPINLGKIEDKIRSLEL
ncbi:hypothetical protein ES703_95069 [subsurface metagenome]